MTMRETLCTGLRTTSSKRVLFRQLHSLAHRLRLLNQQDNHIEAFFLVFYSFSHSNDDDDVKDCRPGGANGRPPAWSGSTGRPTASSFLLARLKRPTHFPTAHVGEEADQTKAEETTRGFLYHLGNNQGYSLCQSQKGLPTNSHEASP